MLRKKSDVSDVLLPAEGCKTVTYFLRRHSNVIACDRGEVGQNREEILV